MSVIRGFVEAVAEHEVRGWAFHEAQPHSHVAVTAWLDGELVGSAVADIVRPDLRDAGIGAGDHEFRIMFDHPIAPANIDRLDVRAECDGRDVLLKVIPGSNHSRADAASNPEMPIADSGQHPVFILGPARSGTSALALALLKCGRYEGNGEGHLLPLARELLHTVDKYYDRRLALTQNDTTLRAVHLAAFQRMVRRGFVQLTRSAFPSGYWIDKTPTAEMVRAAPLMRELWPNARFIFMKRRVIEVVASRRRKFPHDTLENHYLDWVDVFTAWLDVRRQLGDAALEADQREMALNNDAFAAKISHFLQVPPQQAERLRCTLATDHPEQTSEGVGLMASLESLGLSADDERELRLACDPTMRAFGYGYESDQHAA